MEIVGGIVGLLLVGFVIGAIARIVLPGPDPLPVWLTIAIGLLGSFIGGFVFALLGFFPDGASDEEAAAAFFTSLLAGVIGATFLLFLFRRFVQNRGITGAEAQRMPLRPRGLRRIVTRKPHAFLEETATTDGIEPVEALQKLVSLRDAGKFDAAEFERRKAAFVEKI